MHLLRLLRTWAGALERAKIEYFPIAHLRHTFATRMNAAGVNSLTVDQLLGHKTPGILPTYAKVLDEHQRDAIKKLEEYRQSKVTEATTVVDVNVRVN